MGDAEATGGALKPHVRVNSDVHLHAARISQGRSLGFDLGASRQAYVLSLENDVAMRAGTPMNAGDALHMRQHDAALVKGPARLQFDPPADGPGAHVLVVEMAESAGF